LDGAVVERLGLEELAPKTLRETRPGGAAFNLLAEGGRERATLAAEIVPVAGAELAGFLPAGAAMRYLWWRASRPGARPQAAALVERLRGSQATGTYRSWIEPPASYRYIKVGRTRAASKSSPSTIRRPRTRSTSMNRTGAGARRIERMRPRAC
jgi:hypothetical protein